MEITIQLQPEEVVILDRYAKKRGMTKAQALRALFVEANKDKIDAERCMRNINSYERTKKSTPIKAIARKYGIQ